jgi:hypothetical protein
MAKKKQTPETEATQAQDPRETLRPWARQLFERLPGHTVLYLAADGRHVWTNHRVALRQSQRFGVAFHKFERSEC